ncbi:MAG TPA: LacI family DNA-binding transcriptional regulator [Armatimonadota bacterium]|nr:LacI family DNA-binding transcriptional regulator [Armatimonadota bacterium]
MAQNRATIKDVARQAGVSISVVSYVLNRTAGKTITDATRERVFAAASELDYTPNAIARGMRTKRAMSIGIMSFWDTGDTVFSELLRGITHITNQRHYDVVFSSQDQQQGEYRYIELYKQRRIDGIILISPHEGDARRFDEQAHINIIKAHRIPAIIINGYTQDNSLSYIYFDYHQSGYLATQYLLTLGHRSIGFLQQAEGDPCQHQAKQRLQGYHDALTDTGLAIDPALIYRYADIASLLDAVQSGHGPTAVVAVKSHTAWQLLRQAVLQHIRIPDQLSVIAANTEAYSSYLYPALTTVRLPMEDIGKQAAAMLLDTIAETCVQSTLTLPNTVVVRESCRCC